MFSCLGRIGCLFLILVAGVVAWLTRDRWQPRVFGEHGSPAVTWEPVTTAAGDSARQAVASLGRAGGPAYVTLSAAQVASLFATSESAGLPAVLDSVEAAIEDQQVRVRARVPLEEIRGLDALGPLSGLLDKREPIEMSGTLEVVRPGLAAYRIRAVRVADLSIPLAAIPRLLAQLDRRTRPTGLADDAVAIAIPSHIGDVRVSRGQVTLYRSTP